MTEMTDRELIELAAKAAGYEFQYGKQWHDKGQPMIKQDTSWGYDFASWNPLESDADAFRLAAKLGMCLDLRHGKSWAAFTDNPDSALGDYMGANESHNGDELKATRRAITRAAAEIGKAM